VTPTVTPTVTLTVTPTATPTQTPTIAVTPEEAPPTEIPTTDPCSVVRGQRTTTSALAPGIFQESHSIFLPLVEKHHEGTDVGDPGDDEPTGQSRTTLPPVQQTGFELLPVAVDDLDDPTISNALFKLEFEEGAIPSEPTFEVWVTDDVLPTIMRDDGCNGDAVAEDGIYTAEVHLTADEFELVELGATPQERVEATGKTVDETRELMIRDTSVVNDSDRTFDLCNAEAGNSDGAWSFKRLIMDMAWCVEF